MLNILPELFSNSSVKYNLFSIPEPELLSDVVETVGGREDIVVGDETPTALLG